MDLRDVREFLIDTSKYAITILIILLIVVYVASLQQVVGPSMEPTLNNGEILILNKIQFRIFGISRGQIVSLEDNSSKYLIKRVIGIPGDHISYKDNQLYINNKAYDEPYLEDTVITEDFDLKDLGYDTIPDNMYLVLGDNRSNSMDSRTIGLIKKEDIIGKVLIRIFPLNKLKIF